MAGKGADDLVHKKQLLPGTLTIDVIVLLLISRVKRQRQQ